jgi:hypothetical protein
MQQLTSDLDTALAFVIGRVEEEATRSGVPIDDEQHYLLRNLPATPVFSEWVDAEYPMLIPRDIAYEKLCTLAKGARVYDLRMRPEALHEWEFAAAVFKLNRHPMAWLLQWAGLKETREWWDRWLLVIVAVTLVFSVLAVALWAGIRGESWTWIQWGVFGCGCSSVVVSLYFIGRKFWRWQARQNVERCRRDLP